MHIGCRISSTSTITVIISSSLFPQLCPSSSSSSSSSLSSSPTSWPWMTTILAVLLTLLSCPSNSIQTTSDRYPRQPPTTTMVVDNGNHQNGNNNNNKNESEPIDHHHQHQRIQPGQNSQKHQTQANDSKSNNGTIDQQQQQQQQQYDSNSMLFILNHDEQILQTIHSISKGKYCPSTTTTTTTSAATQTMMAQATGSGNAAAATGSRNNPGTSIGSPPSPSSSSSSSLSSSSITGSHKQQRKKRDETKLRNNDGNNSNNKNNNNNHHHLNHHPHGYHHHHHHSHRTMYSDGPNDNLKQNQTTATAKNSKVRFVDTIRSRYNHVQINLPLANEKQRYFHETLIQNEVCRRIETSVDLLAKVLADYDPLMDKFRLINQTIVQAPLIEPNIYRLSIAWIQSTDFGPTQSAMDSDRIRVEFLQCSQTKQPNYTSDQCRIQSVVESVATITKSKWLGEKLLLRLMEPKRQFRISKNQSTEWSNLFYDCHDQRWFITYHSLILQSIIDDGYPDSGIGIGIGKSSSLDPQINRSDPTTLVDVEPINENENENDDPGQKVEEAQYWFRIKGIISADVDVTETDINQCDHPAYQLEDNGAGGGGQCLVAGIGSSSSSSASSRTILNLLGTHKCHNESSECIFLPGHGMYRGGYQCQCKVGFHSTVANLGPTFNGSLMERSFQDKHDGKNPAYDYMFTCERCQPGCDQCQDNSPCLAPYNWAFRISLLTITVFCIIFVFILAFNIYRYRRLKVIKVASPIFLCITLLGCVVMYLETILIFPVMDTTTCVLTKWARNFGFCLTYSSLLLKTWRVSLTYRVKSAHKIKLTDKQLLQWLFPILLVMAIYLGAWTISDTPRAIYITDWNNLKFKQCDFNWWDQSLAIGEFFFLLWGIKVCYSVRNAESLFDEAKYITWAIYNITIVNIVMIIMHLFILPNSGPDLKYFLGFLRTQLSTTTTVVLIFGPKFYRVIKGEGDLWNPRLQARGIIAETYAFNGIGMIQNPEETTVDLYQENDELKCEVQKLAAQLEIMKLSQMEFRNRHLSNHSRFSKIQHQQSQSDV